MKNENITGIGCFAKPATLNRVFQKMIRSYALGTLEAIRAETTDKTFGQGNAGLLDALMADRLQTQPVQAAHGLENKKITGFFLSLKGRRLSLAVFARGERAQRLRYTLTLDGLTLIRQRRLN
jgi:hypothetical protein